MVALERVAGFDAKVSSVLDDTALHMFIRNRVRVVLVEQVIDTGGEFQAFI